jgi:(2Fe-2S) ferredoxin
MGKSKKQVSPFQLEGQFLGFVYKNGKPKKSFRLSTQAGEYDLKLQLPKSSRYLLQQRLQPGIWVQVQGEEVLHLKKNERKRKVYHIVPVGAAVEGETATPAASETAKATKETSYWQVNNPPSVARNTTTSQPQGKILLCRKSSCRKRGADCIHKALAEAVSDRGLQGKIAIQPTGCMKKCKAGPNLLVMPDKTRYKSIQPEEIPQLLEQHFQPSTVKQPDAIAQ